MKYWALSLIFYLFSGTAFAADTLSITDSRVPEMPPGAKVMAAYMTLSNNTNKDVQLTAVKSPAFKEVEMHLSKEVDGFARMLPQKSLQIPAKAKLNLKPGSYHLMLMSPKKQLRDGDMVTLTFSLSDNTQQTLNVPVKKLKHQPVMKCGAGKCGGGKCGGAR